MFSSFCSAKEMPLEQRALVSSLTCPLARVLCLQMQSAGLLLQGPLLEMSIFSFPGQPTRNQRSSLLLVCQTLCHRYTMHISFLAPVLIIVFDRNITTASPLHDPGISPWVTSAHSFYSVFSYFIYSLTTKVMSQNTHCSELLKLFLIVSLTHCTMLESIKNINWQKL